MVVDFGNGAVVTTITDNSQSNATISFPWIAGAFRLQLSLLGINVGTKSSAQVSIRFADSVATSKNWTRLLSLADDTFANYRKLRPVSGLIEYLLL